MPRIPALDPAEASAEVAATLSAIKAKLGGVPNILRTMAVAPSVLAGYLSFSEAASGGALPARLREEIALLSASANGCEYCAAAHQALGKMAGLSPDDIARSLLGDASDPREKAALVFARAVLEKRGQVSDGELAAVKAAGWTNGEVLEIVANVALNVFTNYLNIVAGTDVDFPRVKLPKAA